MMAREYYEQGIIYFLYGLCPVVLLMGLGGWLAFRSNSSARAIGNSLVFGGFAYIFFGALFVGSGLLIVRWFKN